MKKTTGFLSLLKVLIKRNRLGEILVFRGVLSPAELQAALRQQKQEAKPLGRILLEHAKITRRAMWRALAEQWALRGLAACLSFTILFAGAGVNEAQASSIRDIPSSIKLSTAANAAFSPVKAYPALFGSTEKRSYNLDPFTKWTNMFDRFEKAASTESGNRLMMDLQTDLSGLQNVPFKTMVHGVNSLINEQRYIVDSRNWGKSDYWATPIEFFTRGGDCEDFAIAKYVSLRALGVPEERLRVAIVHDKVKDIAHAVLIVYADDGALILDNQTDRVLDTRDTDRYRPIFSINRQAWWLHTAQDSTVLASAK